MSFIITAIVCGWTSTLGMIGFCSLHESEQLKRSAPPQTSSLQTK
jgi:hypothetical protein